MADDDGTPPPTPVELVALGIDEAACEAVVDRRRRA
jgi:hypothetical protein